MEFAEFVTSFPSSYWENERISYRISTDIREPQLAEIKLFIITEIGKVSHGRVDFIITEEPVRHHIYIGIGVTRRQFTGQRIIVNNS